MNPNVTTSVDMSNTDHAGSSLSLLMIAGVSLTVAVIGALWAMLQRQQLKTTYTRRRIDLDDAFARELAEQLNLQLEDGQEERFQVMAQQILIAIAGAFGCEVRDLTPVEKQCIAKIVADYMLQHKRFYRLKNDCWLGGHQFRLIFMESHRLAPLVYANWAELSALFGPTGSFNRHDFAEGWPYNQENPGLFIQHVYPLIKWDSNETAREAFISCTGGNAIVLQTALWIMHDRSITSDCFLTELSKPSSAMITLNDLMPKMMSTLFGSYPLAFKLFSILAVTSCSIPMHLLEDCSKALSPKQQGFETLQDMLRLFHHAGWIEQNACGIKLVDPMLTSLVYYHSTVAAESALLSRRYAAAAKTILLQTLTACCQKGLANDDRVYCAAVIQNVAAHMQPGDATFLRLKTQWEALQGKQPRTPSCFVITMGRSEKAGHSPGSTPPGAGDLTGERSGAAQVMPTTTAKVLF